MQSNYRAQKLGQNKVGVVLLFFFFGQSEILVLLISTQEQNHSLIVVNKYYNYEKQKYQSHNNPEWMRKTNFQNKKYLQKLKETYKNWKQSIINGSAD